MKHKKLLLVTISFMIAMLTCTAVYAQSGDVEKVYTSADVVYESVPPEPIKTSSARAVWMTYEKTVYLEKYTESENPSMSSFPPSIYYTEPNPSGYGENATGTLYLTSVSKIYPNNQDDHSYLCCYKGTMGYFLL